MDTMQEFYEGLENESLRMIQIVGVPRSASTALGRALNESSNDSIYINEALNRNCGSMSCLATAVVNHCFEISPSPDNPVVIITKSMASYTPIDVFKEIAEASQLTIFTIRNPLIQMASLMTRLANDIAVERGADHIRQEDLYKYLGAVCAELESSQRSSDYSKSGWSSIRKLFDQNPFPENSIVVDADDFTQNSRQTLIYTCERAGLVFSESMLDDWKSDFMNMSNGDNKIVTASSAWTSTVTSSKGIKPLSRGPIDIHQLPKSALSHINDVAFPTYNFMLATRPVKGY